MVVLMLKEKLHLYFDKMYSLLTWCVLGNTSDRMDSKEILDHKLIHHAIISAISRFAQREYAKDKTFKTADFCHYGNLSPYLKHANEIQLKASQNGFCPRFYMNHHHWSLSVMCNINTAWETILSIAFACSKSFAPTLFSSGCPPIKYTSSSF